METLIFSAFDEDRYWIEPDGKVHKFKGILHGDWLAEKKLTKRREDSDDAVNEFVTKGWTRAIDDLEGTLFVRTASTDKVLPALRKLDPLVTNVTHVVVDDGTENYEDNEFDVEDGESLDKAWRTRLSPRKRVRSSLWETYADSRGLEVKAAAINPIEELLSVLQDAGFEVSTRYGTGADALPDPATMCPGACEGTGYIPVNFREPAPGKAYYVYSDEEEAAWRPLWEAAEALHPSEDGWQFIPCQICGATGKITASPLEHKKTLTWDFDGTLAEKRPFPQIGPPILPQIELVRLAKDAGIEVIIQSARWSVHDQNPPEEAAKRLEEGAAWLKENDVPYDRLEGGKFPSYGYIDDKAYVANDYARIKQLIEDIASGRSVEATLKIRASMIDYPHEGLPTDIWSKDDKGVYHILPEVKEDIERNVYDLMDELGKDSRTWVTRMLLGSSIATQFYTKYTDIDVKVVIDPKKFKEANPGYKDESPTELVERLDVLAEEHDRDAAYGHHPYEIRVRDENHLKDPDFLKNYDVLYDVTNDHWVKRANTVNPDTYSRKHTVGPALQKALEIAREWDLVFGELRRDLNELKLVRDYLATEPEEKKRDLRKYKDGLLAKVGKAIHKLQDEKKRVKKERGAAYSLAMKNKKFVNAEPDVVKYKLVIEWGYSEIIKGLHKYLEARGDRLALGDAQPLLDVLDGRSDGTIPSEGYGKMRALAQESLANLVEAWGKEHIPDEWLYEPENPEYGREKTIHATVLEGFHRDSIEDFIKSLMSLGGRGYIPAKIELGKVDKFSQSDYDIVKVNLKSRDLEVIHEFFSENFPNTQAHNVYRPHLTVAYVKKGLAEGLVGNMDFVGKVSELLDFIYQTKSKEIVHLISGGSGVESGIDFTNLPGDWPRVLAKDLARRMDLLIGYIKSNGEFPPYYDRKEMVNYIDQNYRNKAGMHMYMGDVDKWSPRKFADCLYRAVNSKLYEFGTKERNDLEKAEYEKGLERGLEEIRERRLNPDPGNIEGSLLFSYSQEAPGEGEDARDQTYFGDDDGYRIVTEDTTFTPKNRPQPTPLDEKYRRSLIRIKTNPTGSPEPMDLDDAEMGNLYLPLDGMILDEHRMVIHANAYDDILKIAKKAVESDPKWQDYNQNPAHAQELGRIQQALQDAQTVADIAEVWRIYQPTTPWSSLETPLKGSLAFF